MADETQFKAGDVVVCVDAWDSFNALTDRSLYMVIDVTFRFLWFEVNGRCCGWEANRFRIATPEERAAFEAANPLARFPEQGDAAFADACDKAITAAAAVRDLLAVIHGDGGQHTDAVGVERSCADAREAVLGMRDALDRAKAARAAAKAAEAGKDKQA